MSRIMPVISVASFALVRRVMGIVFGAVALLVFGMGASAGWVVVSERRTNSQMITVRDHLIQARNDSRKAPVISSLPMRSDVDRIQSVQAVLVSSAERHGCKLTDLQTATEAVPYQSPFLVSDSPAGWTQETMRASTSGSLKSLEAILRDLRKSATPIEPDSIEITRQDVSTHGDVTLNMQLVFRVILPAAGGKA